MGCLTTRLGCLTTKAEEVMFRIESTKGRFQCDAWCGCRIDI